MTPDQQIETASRLASMETTLENQAESIERIAGSIHQLFEITRESLRSNAEFREKLMNQDESLRRAHHRIDETHHSINSTLEHSQQVKETTNKWINRGWGASVVACALLALVQWLVMDRVKSYENGFGRSSDSIITIERRLSWVEHELRKKDDSKR